MLYYGKISGLWVIFRLELKNFCDFNVFLLGQFESQGVRFFLKEFFSS